MRRMGGIIRRSCIRHRPLTLPLHHTTIETGPKLSIPLVMVETPVDITSNKCFICEDCKTTPCSPAPSLSYLDKSPNVETTVAKEFLEDVGLAPAEVPRHMIPTYFAAGYDLRRYASLDVFEDPRAYFPFLPANYIHWLDHPIPLSTVFFVDAKWISWGDARGLDQKQCRERRAEEGDTSIDNKSLNAQDDCSDDPQPSPVERPSKVSVGLFSIPSVEDMRRRRTIYYARPPLIRADSEIKSRRWQSASSFSSASGTSQHTRQKSD